MASVGRPAWSSVDDESLSLILSLLTEDASHVGSAAKGKQAEGTLPDADLALQLYHDELSRAAVYVSDRRMTKSVQSAVQTDMNMLLESAWQESVARCDREIATAHSEGRQPQAQAEVPANTGLSKTERETWEKLTYKYINQSNGAGSDGSFYQYTTSTETDGQPETSAWAASRGQNIPQRRSCVACGDNKDIADLARAPCEHNYCGECLEHLFRGAISDESLFPPRCCRLDIPMDMSRRFLNDELIEQFAQKSVELATPNRTYCHQPTCSAFIPLSMINNGVATCLECQRMTCETCKGASHGGDCPADAGLQQVLEIARENRWQRCPRCFTMIELNTGCFHITCKCRADFCYLCAALWKTCTCAHWDETRLIERAEEIYNRNRNAVVNENARIHANIANPANQTYRANPLPAPVEDRTAAIGQIMEHLEQNHECDHNRWYNCRGPEECEECGDLMPYFIYECRQCSLLACRRCRYNRL